jgi:uracil-DNA glycosylase family 4
LDELGVLVGEVSVCQKCILGRSRTRAVPGEGPPDAKIMFIGEAPGYYEDQQARPFVGAAGKLLEEMLGAIGLTRQDVYITNILKCRPPNNRDPLPDEIAACSDYLDRQIALIQPRVICTLGRFSMAKFFPPGSMRALHGRTARHGAVTCYALYHPAAALRDPRLKDVFAEDFRRIPEVLAQAEAAATKAAAVDDGAPAADAGPSPEQLSLF